MASYHIRQRDPLLDENMQAALERRGKELLGAGLVALGILVSLMLVSYSPDDPSFLSATDAPASNLLGRIGAAIASPLYVIAGHGAWGLAICLFAWGTRFILHRGEERAIGRVIFAPIGIAAMSVYCSTLIPGPDWTHSFGLGGLFGDTVLAVMLDVAPVKATFGLKVLSLFVGVGMLGVGAFVTGFDKLELQVIGRFLMIGSILLYSRLLQLAGIGAALSMRTAHGAADRIRERRDAARDRAADARAWAQQEAEAEARIPAPRAQVAAPVAARRTAAVHRAAQPTGFIEAEEDDIFEDYAEPAPATPARGGLLARVPGLMRRPEPAYEPEPELVERPAPRALHAEEEPTEDRIRARIADAVQNRSRLVAEARHARDPEPAPQHRAARAEPPVSAPAKGLLGRAAAAAGPLFAAAASAAPAAAAAAQTKRAFSAEPRFMPRGAPSPAPRVAEPPLTARQLGERRAAAMPPVEHAPLTAEPMWQDDQWSEQDWDEADPIQAFDADLDPAQFAAPAPGEDALPPASVALAQEEYDYDAEESEEEAAAFAALEAREPRAFNRVPEPKKVVQHVAKKPAAPSRQAQAEAQPRLRFEEAGHDYETPPLSLLASPATIQRHTLSDEALEENARMLESVLDDYGVKGEIVSVRPGPVVTMYELEPAPGLKASRVIGLADDIARSMSALSARVSTVPGRSVIGIELPNAQREKVVLREILAARDFGDGNAKLPLALGKDIAGEPIVANLAKMPHLLIAGTTGSGKSVAINTMILSLLYKLTPDECRLIMIDPKMLELSVYDGIPHLLSPVVTDPKKAVVALKWVVGEMEERYRKMSKMGVRNIDGYNGRVKEALDRGEMFKRTVQTGFDEETGDPIFETEEFQPKSIPYIVVIVDEMADLMMVAGKEIEACIQRLAQMARASGIHLIMATQRPSVDVITGTIKANFPTRISFQVTSKIDSRTILGEMGAEQLLGMGDMLYMAGGSRITRIHGPFVSDEEVEEIVNHLKSFGPPEYLAGVVEGPDDDSASDIDAVLGLGGNTDAEDSLYDQAVQVVLRDRKVSTSYIQRKLGIGYNKAAKLVEQMEEQGVVSASNHVGKREILVPEQ
ncbi:DNA translocase FtsK 4TM domain-containing protein [Frigidibacter sp. MR17.14]|uniref:DNA translocase FtsK n=1 Tax=Frigidibacter sp. MR17.14 TaxID=3126509 RepID=UPI003012A230